MRDKIPRTVIPQFNLEEKKKSPRQYIYLELIGSSAFDRKKYIYPSNQLTFYLTLSVDDRNF